MTERLYNQDVYTKTFTGTVRSCTEVPGQEGYEVILDRTAFFPEGGGQYGDIGTLGGVRVRDTKERDGEVLHYTEGPLQEGDTVEGEIDWKVRFSRMQQHTAEHILSGLVHGRFGYQNVGFHLGDDICTMDFNGPITSAPSASKSIGYLSSIIIYSFPLSCPASDLTSVPGSNFNI